MKSRGALIVGPMAQTGTNELLRAESACSDLVIAVDAGADVCRTAGVDCDVVVGDMDSISPEEFARLAESGLRMVRFPADKDQTDLDLALNEAIHLGCDRAVVTGVFSGRLDHTLAAVGTLSHLEDLAITVAEPSLSAWFVRAGESLALQGYGATISALAIHGDAVVTIKGTKWPLDDQVLSELSSLGMSNVIIAAEALVEVLTGVVFVVSSELDGTKPAVCVRRHRKQEESHS